MPKGPEAGSPAASNDELPTATDAVEAPAGTEAVTDANPAESSAADNQDANEQPKSLLDVVTSAVTKPDPAAEDSSATEGKPDPDASEGEPAKADEAAAGADDSDLPFHTHPRWQELVRERNELKDDAGRYRNITGFMDQHGLAAEEVAEGFEIMAQLKSGDPAELRKALEWFDSRTTALKETLGAVLPDDLQLRVDDGDLDDAAARELASARATARLSEDAGRRREERDQQQRDAEQARTAATSIATAVQGWETDIKGRDPDYAKKADMVTSVSRAIIAEEGRPATPEAAVAIVKRAYEKVDTTLRSVLPKPRPLDTTTPAGSSARATAAPKTLREAVLAGLES